MKIVTKREILETDRAWVHYYALRSLTDGKKVSLRYYILNLKKINENNYKTRDAELHQKNAVDI